MPGALSATIVNGLRTRASSTSHSTDVLDRKRSRFEVMASRLSASDQKLLDHEMMAAMHRMWTELYTKCAA